jgi:formylmethanofuran dehydrogenase subunit E
VNIPDNYDLWEAHDREQEKRLADRPICADCGEHIQHDHFFLINDEAICPDCLESGYRKETEDYIL